jgi:hypothetical protein
MKHTNAKTVNTKTPIERVYRKVTGRAMEPELKRVLLRTAKRKRKTL